MCADVTVHAYSQNPVTITAHSGWPYNAAVIVVVNCLVTVLCACAVTCWVMTLLEGRRQRRELRDKIGTIVSTLYWPVEADVARLLFDVDTMRCATLYRDVSAFDALAFKYRFRTRLLHVPQSSFATRSDSLPDPFQTLKRVERLLDSLVLQVPAVRGRCPEHIAMLFGRTLCGLARTTAAVWSDDQAPTIRRLMRFFGGELAEAGFDAARVSDVSMERLIQSRIPYVDALRLSRNRFILADMELYSDFGAFDARAKVRYIDECLTEPDVHASVARHWPQTLDVYRGACELCVGAGLVPTRTVLPDFTLEMSTDDVRVGECVVVLRHLVRLMCGVEDNLRRLNSDEHFLSFIAGLHDVVCSWNDGVVSTSAVMACIERSRVNIGAYTQALTVDQISIDAELTRVVLDRVATELHRHLDYLTVRRVTMTRRPNAATDRGPVGEVAVTGLSGTPGAASSEATLRGGESEVSVYTMAASHVSPPTQHPGLLGTTSASPKPRETAAPLQGGLVQYQSAERVSLISGGSSMYATAASLSSATNDGDSASSHLSLGLPRYSPPHVTAASATLQGHGVPGMMTSDSDGEYFETPV